MIKQDYIEQCYFELKGGEARGFRLLLEKSKAKGQTREQLLLDIYRAGIRAYTLQGDDNTNILKELANRVANYQSQRELQITEWLAEPHRYLQFRHLYPGSNNHRQNKRE